MEYPRVLIVVMGRIHAADNANNGLLLRNLFEIFPRENLAQIYSSDDNGDEGFFCSYYQLKQQDRRFGRIFFRLKATALKSGAQGSIQNEEIGSKFSISSFVHRCGKKLLMDSGLYELVFRPRLSREMISFIKDFRPDYIFSQGYNLAFTLIPLMIFRRFDVPIIYYPTDDWPEARYIKELGYRGFISKIVRKKILSTSNQLVGIAKVCIAFNTYTKFEYLARYGKEFTVIMHGDEFSRFDKTEPKRNVSDDMFWIVSTGDFDKHRTPLLYDLDEACRLLNSKGIKVFSTVYPVAPIKNTQFNINDFQFTEFCKCPMHDELVSVLKGADIMFLPERFDGTVKIIRNSISSKAHLFMFSKKPIIVYSDPLAGIGRYAIEEGWAVLVGTRNPEVLAYEIETIIKGQKRKEELIECAIKTAKKNHILQENQNKFINLLLEGTK